MMTSRQIRMVTAAGLVALGTTVWGAVDDALVERAREGLLKAGTYWADHVASHGGYVWEYSTDLVTRRRGEGGQQPKSVNWVQAGTPMIGDVYLTAYSATGEQRMLEAALAAGHCLAYGQLQSGGWHYSIQHDPEKVRHWYHHLGDQGKGKHNTTTFDDDNTQSATRFLIDLDRYLDDDIVDESIQRALSCFLKAQYRGGPWDGAWPQRYPPPTSGYGAFPTFNDNSMSDCVRTLLKAYETYGDTDCLDAVKRCLEFYLRAQLDPPQAAWAQQYDPDLQPAWARRFEPPSVTGGESRGNCMLLLDMYVHFGDTRYLDAVGRCVDWYRASRIGGSETRGVWARFYELKTNRPLYFTRTYKLTYKDDDLPVHYSFKGNYGADTMMQRFERMRSLSLEQIRQAGERPDAAAYARQAAELEAQVREVLATQDELGRWVKVVAKREQVRDAKGRVGYEVDESTQLNMMYSRTFVRNMRTLSHFLIAVKRGPRVDVPKKLPAE